MGGSFGLPSNDTVLGVIFLSSFSPLLVDLEASVGQVSNWDDHLCEPCMNVDASRVVSLEGEGDCLWYLLWEHFNGRPWLLI